MLNGMQESTGSLFWQNDFLPIISNLIAVSGVSHSEWSDQGVHVQNSCVISRDASHSICKAVEWSVSLCMHTILTFKQYPKLGVAFSNTLCIETISGSILWICFKTGNGEVLQNVLYITRWPPSIEKDFLHYGVKHTNQLGSNALQRRKWDIYYICQ